MVAAVKDINLGTSFAITAPQKPLASALAQLARIADAKSTMQVLANVAIRQGYGGTSLVATDLNITLTYLASWQGSPGGFTVPAKQIAEIVKGTSAPDLVLRKSASTALTIEGGGAETHLFGVPDRDFPKVPVCETPANMATLYMDRFADLLERVLPAACLDETRFHLNGVFLQTEGGIVRLVTTDGHRLALAQELGVIGDGFACTKGVIIPSKAARELVRLYKSERKGDHRWTITVKDHLMFVRCGSHWEMAIKLIDAQFPAFWQVIPADHKKRATIKREPLLASMKRSVKAYCEGRGVRFAFSDGAVTLTTDHPDRGTTTERLAATDGERAIGFAIGMNPRYVVAALDAFDDDEIELFMGGELDPIVVRSAADAAVQPNAHGAAFLVVIMPMRI